MSMLVEIWRLFKADASFYDKWCLRAGYVAQIQFTWATFYAFGLLIWPYIGNMKYIHDRFDGNVFLHGPNGELIPYLPVGYDHEAISNWRKVAVFVPICLAALNLPLQRSYDFRLWRFQQDAVKNLLVFGASQALMLLVCTLLTVPDLMRPKFDARPVLSSICWLVPAIFGFIHGMFGLYAVLSHCRQDLVSFHRQNILLQRVYLDDDDNDDVEEGPLAQAYRLYHGLQARSAVEDEADHGLDVSTRLDHEGIPSTNPSTDRLVRPNTSSGPRLRWQNRTENMGDGGRNLSLTIAPTIMLVLLCGRLYKITVENTKFPPPEYERLIFLITLIPVCSTFVANLMLSLALNRPRFVIIFLSLSFSIIGATVWTMTSVAILGPLAEYRPYGMVFLSPFVALGHFGATFISLQLEWDPDSDSFLRMFRRIRQSSSTALQVS